MVHNSGIIGICPAKLGVDKFNPYEQLYSAIPEVPVIPGEFGPEELGLGNGEGMEEEEPMSNSILLIPSNFLILDMLP